MHIGQAQKELTVNEALARTDALLHIAIEGTATSPPATPTNGEAWMVGASATGIWAGHDGQIACRQAGNWLYIQPRDGLRVLDRSTGQDRRYAGSWQIATSPVEPSGGSTVDTQARAAIGSIIAALRTAGVLPGA
ncbi:MAG TPA: DUF2793 domain-containing protein [Novosphingobium sp.]|nr:DUF2793 domain-containing protein [Novosphingobium sp.]